MLARSLLAAVPVGSAMERLVAENDHLRETLSRSAASMKRAHRLASFGVLTAGLAHEIRNPLVVMRAFAQLLPERWQDEDFRGEFARVAVAEVDRVESLVRELLRVHESGAEGGAAPIAPSTPAALEVTSFPATTEAQLPLLRLHALRRGVDLLFEPGEPLKVAVDPERLQQAVINLVLNAIEATPEGGSVSLVCGGRGQGSDRHATLSVRDSGCGIEAGDLPHIFEPFFTTREHGTGLGLAITREIVRGFRGAIAVESAPGRGTTFVVELPAVDESESSTRPVAPAA